MADLKLAMLLIISKNTSSCLTSQVLGFQACAVMFSLCEALDLTQNFVHARKARLRKQHNKNPISLTHALFFFFFESIFYHPMIPSFG